MTSENNEESNDENSEFKNDFFINSNPIYNYINTNLSQISNNNATENEQMIKYKKRRYKNYQLCNLKDPKLIEAYNEGYYGFNNVPKQYYIYPRFSKKEYNNIKIQNSNEIVTDSLYEKINKENNRFIVNNNRLKEVMTKNYKNSYKNANIENDEFISSYINYPYPKLINISTNLFGSSHNIKTSHSNLNQNITNNNNEKENNQNISNNYKSKNENIDCDTDEDSGNFYFINNTITTRNVPFQNIPDDDSIDDDEKKDE